jgi:hypothetical protein
VVADQRDLFGAPPAAAGSRISAKALAALQGAVVGHDHVDLGGEQLARSTYLEAAAVLETVGARWHTGRKRHLFTESWDRAMFDDVLATGEAPPANPLSYFATPRPIAEDMLRQRQIEAALHFYGELVVLEPSTGTGALALATAERWAAWAKASDDQHPEGDAGFAEWYRQPDNLPRLRMVLVELEGRRGRILRGRIAAQIEALMPGRIVVEVVVGDFLQLDAAVFKSPRLVMMNPPFSVPGDKAAWWTHLQRALSVVHARGAVGCIVPPSFRWQERAGMRAGMRDALALISRGTAWPIPSGAFKQAGTDIATWALTILASEALEPEGVEVPVITIISTHHLFLEVAEAYRAQKAWGEPRHGDGDGTWGKMLLRVTRAVALAEHEPGSAKAPHDQQINGDGVSFSPAWQAMLSRELWARFAEDGAS